MYGFKWSSIIFKILNNYIAYWREWKIKKGYIVEGDAPIVYFKQRESDGENFFDNTLQNTTLL